MTAIRIIAILVLMSMSLLTSKAQLIGSIKFDPDEISIPSKEDDFKLIFEEALKPGLFIVKTAFQICDKESGDLYGLNGKDEFGEVFGIGVQTNEGILLYDKSVRPWRYNEKFSKYEEKYDPVFTQPMQKSMSADTPFSPLDYDVTSGIILIDSTLYKFESNTFDKVGFKLTNETGKQSSWTVWFTSKNIDKLTEGKNVGYIIIHQNIDIPNRGCLQETIQPTSDMEIIGGIVLTATAQSPGVIEFSISGVAIPIENKWKLAFPEWGCCEAKPVEVTETEEKNKEDDSELTPVDTQKGKKKSPKDNKKKKK